MLARLSEIKAAGSPNRSDLSLYPTFVWIRCVCCGMIKPSPCRYGLFIYLITYAGAVFATQVAYLVAISGVAWGIIIFDEQHSVWVWLSLACILTGLTLIRPRRRKKAAD